MKHILTLIYSLVAIQFTYSQKQIHVVDSLTGKGLPFATVECFEKKWGLYTDSAGFATIPENMLQETHKVSYVGYQSKEINFTSTNSIALNRLTQKLQDVTAAMCKKTIIKELTVIKEEQNLLGFSLKSSGYTWAVYVSNNINKEAKLLSITYEAKGWKEAKPDAPIRLRFFEYDSVTKIPGAEVTMDDILITPKKLNTEITQDLSKYNILIPRNGIVVAFEIFDAGVQYRYTKKLRFGANLKDVEYYGWEINGTEGINNVGFGRV